MSWKKFFEKAIRFTQSSCLVAVLFFLFRTNAFADFPHDCETPYKIGAVFSLSSWGANGGAADLHGIELAIEDINASGGIKNCPLKLVIEDNQSDLKNTVTAIQKLSNLDRVLAILGPNWDEFLGVAAPVAEKNRIPLISPSGSKNVEGPVTHFVFTLWPPHEVAVRPLARYLKGKRFENIAVLVTENAYYEGILHATETELRGSDVRIGSTQRFNSGYKDFRSAISRLKDSDADAVYALLLNSGEFSSFVRQAKELELSLPIFAANTIPFSEIIQASPEIANGVIYFDYVVPGEKKFFERYRKQFKREPGFSSAKAYDAVIALRNAIEKCGTEAEDIQRCLSTTEFEGLSGPIHFDNNGVLESSGDNTFLMQVKNGAFVRLDSEGGKT